jgi:hypothetical protein
MKSSWTMLLLLILMLATSCGGGGSGGDRVPRREVMALPLLQLRLA